MFDHFYAFHRPICEINLFTKYPTKMKSAYEIDAHHSVKSTLNDFYSLPDTYQKPHSFPVLTRLSSATSDFVNKN